MRFRPFPMVSASFSAPRFGFRSANGGFSSDHSQKEAISAAFSAEIVDLLKPDSIIGMSAAAALRRLIWGVAQGILFDISPL